MTLISFVMLSYQDADMVINAVSSIRKLKTKYSYDIFVVDNGSSQATKKKITAKCKGITLIPLPKNVGTAAYDAALKRSKAKYVFFTGCDVEMKTDMLDKLVVILEKDNNCMQVTPKYVNINNKKSVDLGGTWLSRSFYSGTFKNHALGHRPVEIPYIGTGLLRRTFIDRWGYLFDPDFFFYGEDVDLGMRIRLSGHTVKYVPDSIVYHIGSVSRTIHKHSFLTFLMERNLMRTAYTSLSFFSLLWLSFYIGGMRLVAIIKDFFTLHFADAFARIRALFWVLFHLPHLHKKRRLVQKRRTISDSQLFTHFSESSLFTGNHTREDA